MDQELKSRITYTEGNKRLRIAINTLLVFMPVFLVILTITILIIRSAGKNGKTCIF